MKKHLIAAAVAAAVAVPAVAQVTVYGTVGVTYDTTDTTGTSGREDTSITAGRTTGLGTPVIGLRGSEDLGGGLKAEFDLQGQLDTQTGIVGGASNNDFFNRQSWVGLTGGFGSIKVGRMDNAAKMIDGFGETGANLFDDDGSTTAGVYLLNRDANSIRYDSPVFNGIAFSVSHSSSSDVTQIANQEVNAFNVRYTQGPLSFGVAQASTKAAGSAFSVENNVVGASFKTGLATFDAAYQRAELSTTTKVTHVGVGAIVPLSGALNLHVNYQKRDHTTVTSDATMVGALAAYSLSKRTTAFVGYQDTNNGSTTADSSTASIGIQHSF